MFLKTGSSEDQQLLFFMTCLTKRNLKEAGGRLSEFNGFYLDGTILTSSEAKEVKQQTSGF